jgi:hypothetical protein
VILLSVTSGNRASAAGLPKSEGKMKNYLNKEEMTVLVFIRMLTLQIEEMRKGWTARDNMSEEEQTHADAAIEAMQKLIDSVLGRLKPDQYKKYQLYLRANEVHIRPAITDWEYRLEVEREMERDKKVGSWIEWDVAAALADLLLYRCCHPCCQEACDRETCPIKRVFTLMDMPMCNEYAEGDVCPYDNGGE